ncbi:MAG: lamin tail domain-containing protein [Bacteroidota bacterium]|nr:lamin tail domain-containing protein [Bacteroidota bacterium]
MLLFFYVVLFSGSFGYAQISESFNDGDFTNNPSWIGNTSDFVVNPAFQLQSNSKVANNNFYLSTPNALATALQWEFWVRIAFNPSSANYVDAYLTASASDLKLNSTTGYFVRIGNTEDEISLYRKDATGATIKIIDGVNGILNKSNNLMKIKVTRDATNQWTLLRDLTGTGNSYIREGAVSDNTYTTSAYFGFLIKQSTAGFFQRHFFDDIEIKNFILDISPPEIISASAVSSTTIDLLFNEPLDDASSQEATNYFASNGLEAPITAILDAVNPALIHLTFSSDLTNGIAYTLIVKNIKDLAGNAINNASTSFSIYTPQRYDIIIDELFPDPNPQVGLPLSKFLELKNVTAFPINLQGWKLIEGNTTATLPNYLLRPDSFLIVCAINSVSSYLPYGPAIGIANFPSMNISGATIVLKSLNNKTIHAVQYDLTSYKNELKKDGGWSLEMIDTKNPCTGFNNWKASVDGSGGTPGRKNSVDAIYKDETPPKLLRAFVLNNNMITLVFDEPVDSSGAATVANYTIEGLDVISVFIDFTFFNKVTIKVNNIIIPGTVYSVAVKSISDCAGNIIKEKNYAKFGIAQDADSLDLVINEILFNALPLGNEYVEIYNRSSKIIDLSKIFIANRNSSNTISNIKLLTTENILLFPAEFMVLTADPDAVKNQYITTNPDAFLKLKSMPSFPNDKGNVIILNIQGSIVDEVKYSDKWHFALIHNTKGVSLERISYDGPSVQTNFHSAATSVGYGTPGYKNSQYQLNEDLRVSISVIPEIFSPDNDGTDDFVTINYNFPSPGYVSNITIFDASGRPVRYLQKNSLCGINGYFRWDGLDNKSRKLPQGIYIIYTEIFNDMGNKSRFKNTVTLARRY